MTIQTTNLKILPGIYAAVLTPMQEDWSVGTKELTAHCQDLLKRGCSGIVLMGTTGEGPSFSVQEKIDVLKEIIDLGVPSQNIILSNGSSNLADTLLLAKASIFYKIKALLIAPPSFFQVQEEGVIAFYRKILQTIDSSALPLLLYHIPQFSKVPITLKIIETLLTEFPFSVIGIKESEGNLPFAKSILKQFPGFQVFVGNEQQIPETVYSGGSGSICGIANLYPELLCSLYEQSKQDPSASSQKLDAVFKALENQHFVSAFKAFLESKKPKAQMARPFESSKFVS
jgi:4-hydroxy-tetrahydrodipicolinate synthase